MYYYSYTSLQIARNDIRDEGAKAIGQALAKGAALVGLYISILIHDPSHEDSNDITAEGVEALLQTPVLIILSIGIFRDLNLGEAENKLGRVGAKVVARLLANNPVLLFLDMSHTALVI